MFEVFNQSFGAILKDAAILVGVPVLRSISGWLSKALEDNKITKYEIAQLLSTIVRVGSITVVGWVGLNEFGIDVSVFGASAGAFILDMLIRALKTKPPVPSV